MSPQHQAIHMHLHRLALLQECVHLWTTFPGKHQVTALLQHRLKGLSPEDMLIYQQIAAAGNMGESRPIPAATRKHIPHLRPQA